MEIKPLVSESSTAESSQVQMVLNLLSEGDIFIPDYQRDSDQWSQETKSLFIESIINNLTIPAFFFEVSLRDGVEVNEVVDGQQRITTLNDFFENKLRLVDSDDAPYISPFSIHYAGKTFHELPIQYQKSFKNYKLSIIKLRNLGDMKLEIFRRINQGGQPLSGQDIRLSYYGDTSPSVAFIRLIGIYDKGRRSSNRTIESVKLNYGFNFPWSSEEFEIWHDWWGDKEIAKGQTPSEMFLWSLISVYHNKLNDLLSNSDALHNMHCKYNGTMDEALDAFCAYLKYQDSNSGSPRLFFENANELVDDFSKFFMDWFSYIAINFSSIKVQRYRLIASVIGALYVLDADPAIASRDSEVIEKIAGLIRSPIDTAKQMKKSYPAGKGRWGGGGGYYKQFEFIHDVTRSILS